MSLRDDVLKYASEIGLSGAQQGGGGFNDTDFRPKSKAKRKREKERGGGKKGSRERQRGDNGGRARPLQGQQQLFQQRTKHVRFEGNGNVRGNTREGPRPVGPDPNEQRAWNEGAGPIPDSLLGDATASYDGFDEVLSASVWHSVYDDLMGAHTAKSAGAGKKKRKKNRSGSGFDSRAGELRLRAERLAEDFTKRSEVHMKKFGGQDAQWLMTAKAKGTVRDKIAAASLLVQQNVVANLGSLEMLVNMVVRNKGSRDGIQHTLEALGELFSTTLLPERKLLYFSSQVFVKSGHSESVDDKLLIVCYIEDRVKALYNEFVEGLETLTKDNLEFLKQKAIKTAFTLLKTKPEQEARLLSILVNKLGDPSRKIASNVVYFLHSLFEEHPGMKSIVAQEVENFLFRPSLAPRAQYTSVIFLNQILLSKKESEGGPALARKLINLYFSFFQLLTNPATREEEDDAGGQSRHKKFGDDKKKAGSKKNKSGDVVVDSKILGALLTGANRAFPFVSDTDIDGLIEKHSPKLFQLAHGSNFGTCVQALHLLYHLYNTKMSLSDRYYRALYSALLRKDLLTSNKASMFLSLLFKSLKADVNKVRVATFLNRLLQVTAEAKPNVTCGSLLLISETMKHFPALWAYVNEGADNGGEEFKDVEEESDAEEVNEAEEGGSGDDSEGEEEEKQKRGGEKQKGTKSKVYDMLKRDPQYSGMEETCFWELSLLSKHFHPSTSVMARTLLAGTHIVYDGDPFQDLNVVNFLGKFVQKKPKAISSKFSKAADPGEGLSEAFADLEEGQVNPADLFHYYNQRVRKVVKKDAGADIEKGGSRDDKKLLEAMLATGGENSDDSGEISGSASDDDLDDSDDVATSSSTTEDSEEEELDFASEDEGTDEKKAKTDKDSGPFASAADYADQIDADLSKSKEYLKELLGE